MVYQGVTNHSVDWYVNHILAIPVADPRIPRQRAPTPKWGGAKLLFDKISPQNCMKMKEIGPRGGNVSLAPSPLRSANAYTSTVCTVDLVLCHLTCMPTGPNTVPKPHSEPPTKTSGYLRSVFMVRHVWYKKIFKLCWECFCQRNEPTWSRLWCLTYNNEWIIMSTLGTHLTAKSQPLKYINTNPLKHHPSYLNNNDNGLWSSISHYSARVATQHWMFSHSIRNTVYIFAYFNLNFKQKKCENWFNFFLFLVGEVAIIMLGSLVNSDLVFLSTSTITSIADTVSFSHSKNTKWNWTCASLIGLHSLMSRFVSLFHALSRFFSDCHVWREKEFFWCL